MMLIRIRLAALVGSTLFQLQLNNPLLKTELTPYFHFICYYYRTFQTPPELERTARRPALSWPGSLSAATTCCRFLSISLLHAPHQDFVINPALASFSPSNTLACVCDKESPFCLLLVILATWPQNSYCSQMKLWICFFHPITRPSSVLGLL